MTARFDAIGLIVADMARSLAFYRRLGLEIPADADAESHVQAALPGGTRMLWDTADMIRSFDPEWTTHFTGVFAMNEGWRQRFLDAVRPRSGA